MNDRRSVSLLIRHRAMLLEAARHAVIECERLGYDGQKAIEALPTVIKILEAPRNSYRDDSEVLRQLDALFDDIYQNKSPDAAAGSDSGEKEPAR